MEKMKISDRAKQFAPFASLRGFDEEVRKKERVEIDRKTLSEEEQLELSQKVISLKKGDLITVVYYLFGEYKKTTGVITAIDLTLKNLTVVKTKLEFEDIYSIEKVSAGEIWN